MLKVRVMPTLLHRGHGLVKGVAFDSWRRVGTAMQAVKVFNLREVDELVFLDIEATPEGRGPDLELVDELADECFMPLTVGGGVRGVDDVRALLRVGADKVALCTLAVDAPDVVRRIADRFGSQCVVVSVDARRVDAGHEAFTRCGTHATGRSAVDVARAAEAAGAGEIVVTSIDRDGTLSGYDLDLVHDVAGAVTVPVVASGGAGSPEDMAAALAAGASAVAAGAMFQFTEQTPLDVKHHLTAAGYPTRGSAEGR